MKEEVPPSAPKKLNEMNGRDGDSSRLQKNMPHTPHIIPAVHLFLIKDDKILLLRRSNTGYEDGKYSVPAGHVESNETITQAMIREAGEEIGVKISIKNLEFAHVMHRKSGTEERIDFFFVCKKWSGEVQNCEPKKCDNLEWYDLKKIPANVIPYVRSAIRHVSNNLTFSEFGWKS